MEDAIDAMKVSNTDSGRNLWWAAAPSSCPTTWQGAATVLKPEHFGCANAIGSAISKVSGTYEQLIDYDEIPRDQALEQAKAEAIDTGCCRPAPSGRPWRSSRWRMYLLPTIPATPIG